MPLRRHPAPPTQCRQSAGMTEYTSSPAAVAAYFAATARTKNWVDTIPPTALSPSAAPTFARSHEVASTRASSPALSSGSDGESEYSLPPRMMLRYPDGRDVSISHWHYGDPTTTRRGARSRDLQEKALGLPPIGDHKRDRTKGMPPRLSTHPEDIRVLPTPSPTESKPSNSPTSPISTTPPRAQQNRVSPRASASSSSASSSSASASSVHSPIAATGAVPRRTPSLASSYVYLPTTHTPSTYGAPLPHPRAPGRMQTPSHSVPAYAGTLHHPVYQPPLPPPQHMNGAYVPSLAPSGRAPPLVYSHQRARGGPPPVTYDKDYRSSRQSTHRDRRDYDRERGRTHSREEDRGRSRDREARPTNSRAFVLPSPPEQTLLPRRSRVRIAEPPNPTPRGGATGSGGKMFFSRLLSSLATAKDRDRSRDRSSKGGPSIKDIERPRSRVEKSRERERENRENSRPRERRDSVPSKTHDSTRRPRRLIRRHSER